VNAAKITRPVRTWGRVDYVTIDVADDPTAWRSYVTTTERLLTQAAVANGHTRYDDGHQIQCVPAVIDQDGPRQATIGDRPTGLLVQFTIRIVEGS